MIELGELYFGLKDHYKVFSVLKNGGFVKLPNGLGLLVSVNKGYASYKLVAVGKEISNNVLFNMQQKREPKKEIPKKKKVIVDDDNGEYKEGGLFD